jgi:hypothetical protein
VEIREVTLADVPKWIALSKEYDKYVLELVPDLTEWYEGGATSMAFDDYMQAKIVQHEAFLIEDECKNLFSHDKKRWGIIAISKKNNRITFFGISHNSDLNKEGELLVNYALSLLDVNSDISINVLKSKAERIQEEYNFFAACGFSYSYDDQENGVPVVVITRKSGSIL